MPLPQRSVVDDAIRFVTSMNKGGVAVVEEEDKD